MIVERAAFNAGENAQYTPIIERGQIAPTVISRGPHAIATPVIGFSCKDDGGDAEENLSPTLRAMNNAKGSPNGGGQVAIAYSFDALTSNAMQSDNPLSGHRKTTIARTLDTRTPCPSKNQGGIGIIQGDLLSLVRRLMPIECERLQGFPDNWTRISWRGKPPEDCPDGLRYKAIGNSMAVPVMKWLGERIKYVDSVLYGGSE